MYPGWLNSKPNFEIIYIFLWKCICSEGRGWRTAMFVFAWILAVKSTIVVSTYISKILRYVVQIFTTSTLAASMSSKIILWYWVFQNVCKWLPNLSVVVDVLSPCIYITWYYRPMKKVKFTAWLLAFTIAIMIWFYCIFYF